MKRLAWIVVAWIVFGCVAAACGSDANVAGNYTVAITNGVNGCSIGNWDPGAQPTASAQITQAGSDVTLTVQGLAGIGVAALLGTNVMTGDVSGDNVLLEVAGTQGFTTGNCAYTFNSKLDADLSGDTLSGHIDYRAATNGGTDCGTREDCVSRQDFNATRPPAP